MKPPKKLYKYHVKNLRSVSDGLDHVFRSARDAVARDDQRVIRTHIRLLLFLLGVWSEVRLLKMLYEPDEFSQTERCRILKATALERWLLAVEIAFRRHYKIPKATLRPPQLASTAYLRLKTLKKTLRNELREIITMRNKLAHGQWIYPLNDAMNGVAQDQMDALRRENILSLIEKKKLLEILCQVIHDLVVSKPTFDRDWDKHLGQFEQTRTNIERKSYKKWEDQIRAKYRRGREKRLSEYKKILLDHSNEERSEKES